MNYDYIVEKQSNRIAHLEAKLESYLEELHSNEVYINKLQRDNKDLQFDLDFCGTPKDIMQAKQSAAREVLAIIEESQWVDDRGDDRVDVGEVFSDIRVAFDLEGTE